MFTKQHYIEVARVIRASGARGKVRAALVLDFGRMFARNNSRFDWARWREACEDGLVCERPDANPRPL